MFNSPTAQQRYRFSFPNALIVAVALESGRTRLLAEDLQHRQRIDDLVIDNPLRDGGGEAFVERRPAADAADVA